MCSLSGGFFMKKYQITILALSMLLAVLGVGFGIKMNLRNKNLLVENERLKKQLICKTKKQEEKKKKNKQ